jgi:Domain of unknown function (DUF222)
MTQQAPAYATTAEAVEIAKSALRFVYETQLPFGEHGELLRGLEGVTGILTAARASTLGAFTAGLEFVEHGDYGARSFLMHRTRVSQGAASGYTGWARRLERHPALGAALVAEEITESWAYKLAKWTDQLPAESRPPADEILLGAAKAGLEIDDLAALAAEILARAMPEDDGPDPFEARYVKLETTIDGAGILRGDLTPECAAVVRTVLDALSKPAEDGDLRSRDERVHDGLQQAMEQLVAGGLLGERAGAPVKVWAHVSLTDLMQLPGSTALLKAWAADAHAAWAAHCAASFEGGGDGDLWLAGDRAAGMGCDGSVTPVVTGAVNPGAFYPLVQLSCELATLDNLGHTGSLPEASDLAPASGAERTGPASGPASAAAGTSGGPSRREALEQAIIGQAVELLSGPGGLVSYVRRGMFDGKLGGPSIPLDVGYSETVPAGIRHAVRLRDGHCRWAGGCTQPASACEVHHTTHKAHGGKTSLQDCVLLCWFHHHIVVHQLGWTLVVNPDGTTTAWNRDRSKTLHSHGPPPSRE